MHAHEQETPAGWQKVEWFAVPILKRSRSHARRPSWWEKIECSSVLIVPTPPVLMHHLNLLINCRPSADATWPATDLKIVVMALVRFLSAAQHSFVGFSCCDPRIVQGGCRVLALAVAGVHRRMDHFSFEAFLLCCHFDVALGNFAY